MVIDQPLRKITGKEKERRNTKQQCTNKNPHNKQRYITQLTNPKTKHITALLPILLDQFHRFHPGVSRGFGDLGVSLAANQMLQSCDSVVHVSQRLWPKAFRMIQVLLFYKVRYFRVIRCFCQMCPWYNEIQIEALKKYQKLLLRITQNSCNKPIFAALTLLFQDLSNSPWRAASQLLDQILTDGSPFFQSQCLEFVRISGFLIVHPSLDHKFSMGLRSGEFPGVEPKILMFCHPSHFILTCVLRQAAPSCWERLLRHQTALEWLGEVAL